MKITSKRRRVIEVVDDVLCNKCGGSLVAKTNKHGGELVVDDPLTRACGLIEIEIRGGWFSPVLPDGQRYQFSLCEPCLAGLFKTFTINPAVG